MIGLASTILAAGLLAFAGGPAMADTNIPEIDEAKAIKISQAAIGKAIGEYTMIDSAGRTVRFSDFKGRPLLVNFIYTSCAHSCGIITSHLANVYENAWDVLGKDGFASVTIGFDTPRDTPQRMRSFLRKQGVRETLSWKFLSADEKTIKSLTETAGFTYFKSPKGFDHLDQVTIVDAEGKIHSQIYGAAFDKPLLIEPLKELVLGTPAPYRSLADLIKKVRLFCTLYDPASGRYAFDYSLFIQISAGIVIIGGAIIFLIRDMWLARRRTRRERSA